MSDARTAIFGRLRSTASAAPAERDRRREEGLRPAFTQAPVERFLAKVRAAQGSAEELGTIDDVPAATARYLSALEAEPAEPGGSLCVAPAALVRDLDWQTSFAPARTQTPRWSVRVDSIGEHDQAALTVAYAAVAETGSLVMFSGKETPTSLNFLPDVYLCVVPTTRIVPHLEDLWTLMRKESRSMPRSLNWIGGPSRTADVEQTVQLGAHGPRKLHVLLVHER